MQIGEISLIKEMTNIASQMEEDEVDETTALEEKLAALEKKAHENGQAVNGGSTPAADTSSSTAPAETAAAQASGAEPSAAAEQPEPHRMPSDVVAQLSTSGTQTPVTPQTPISAAEKRQSMYGNKKVRAKLTPEQRAKLEERERERKKADEEHQKELRKAMEERIKMLEQKLIERLRPYVDAKHPGAADDPETKVWEGRMRTEAEDLKLESFGVEVSLLVGRRAVVNMELAASTYNRLHLHSERPHFPQITQVPRHVCDLWARTWLNTDGNIAPVSSRA
jgi:hypothetical protein